MTEDFPRPDPPLSGSEAETLVGFLAYQRATFAWKCSGVSDEDLRRTIHPTDMSLAGLLKHLARVEDHWFSETVGRGGPTPPWDAMPWAAEWTNHVEHSGDELRAMWQSRVEVSDGVVRSALPDLGATYPAWGGQAQVSLRWVLVHMVEEYARHNGHADLLRQAVDGSVGE